MEGKSKMYILCVCTRVTQKKRTVIIHLFGWLCNPNLKNTCVFELTSKLHVSVVLHLVNAYSIHLNLTDRLMEASYESTGRDSLLVQLTVWDDCLLHHLWEIFFKNSNQSFRDIIYSIFFQQLKNLQSGSLLQ